MINKEEFVAQLDRAGTMLGELPVTAAIVRWLSDQLKKGDPSWWKKTLKAWEKREFVAWNEALSLMLASIHFEALNDAKSPFVPFFPSCGGTAEADPAPALAKFFEEPPDSFFEHLKTGRRRYHTKGAATAWWLPASSYFVGRKLPYYLVQINAGAGLDLAADYAYLGTKDDYYTQARIGLDPAPMLLQDMLHRRWQTAAYFPDSMKEIRALDAAIDVMQRESRKDPNFIQLVECPTKLAPKFIAKNIPADDDSVGLTLFTNMTTSAMNDADYQAFSQDLLATLRPWGDRALWIDIESVRGEVYSNTLQFRANRVVDGLLKGFDFARVEFSSKAFSVDGKALKEFLSLKK